MTFKKTKSLPKLFAFGINPRHQIKQIVIAADDVIRFSFNCQIDIFSSFGSRGY